MHMYRGMHGGTSDEVSPAFKAENRSGVVYAVHITFFILSLSAVSARLAAAKVSRRKFALDDYLAVAAEVLIIGIFTNTMLWLKFGLGRHAIVVEQADITRFFQVVYANEILYAFGLTCARLSLVVLYNRIFGLFNARYYLYGLMAFLCAWSLYSSIPTILACIPVQNFWTTHQNCINVAHLYIGIAVGSIMADAVLIAVPIPYVLSLSMPVNKKILLMISFIFGGFNCFITIIRLIIVSSFNMSDPTWGTVDLMVWTGMEAYGAVICCCLPTLRPLLHVQRSRCRSRRSEPSTRESKKLRQGSDAPSDSLHIVRPPPVARIRSNDELLGDEDVAGMSHVTDSVTMTGSTSRSLPTEVENGKDEEVHG